MELNPINNILYAVIPPLLFSPILLFLPVTLVSLLHFYVNERTMNLEPAARSYSVEQMGIDYHIQCRNT